MILAIEQWRKGAPGSREISWGVAIACGVAQLIAAVFPGTSRSGRHHDRDSPWIGKS